MRNIKFCVMTFANIFQWANFIHRISFNEFLVKKYVFLYRNALIAASNHAKRDL